MYFLPSPVLERPKIRVLNLLVVYLSFSSSRPTFLQTFPCLLAVILQHGGWTFARLSHSVDAFLKVIEKDTCQNCDREVDLFLDVVCKTILRGVADWPWAPDCLGFQGLIKSECTNALLLTTIPKNKYRCHREISRGQSGVAMLGFMRLISYYLFTLTNTILCIIS